MKHDSLAKKLAKYPIQYRYCLPKQYWAAMRLGLYRAILTNSPRIKTAQVNIAYLIAKLKRFQLSECETECEIIKVLSDRFLLMHHREFICETFYLYPQIFVNFFKNHPKWLKKEYCLGLYLSHVSRQSSKYITDDIRQSLLNRLPDSIDKSCLINNLCLLTPQQKIENLNQIFAEHHLIPISLLDLSKNFCVNNLCVGNEKILPVNSLSKSHLVSVLVTAFNAQNTIAVCLNSLLKQTWYNLQIIVINDASTDNTRQIIEQFAKNDARIMAINLPENVGTFTAKTIGARYATGEFLTCQDSDDFAHPQKIERQILPLINNSNLIATSSYWLRLDEDGNYYSRQYFPFLRQNTASPLFRRKQVEQETGLWHLVRMGADSEFLARLKLVYGDKKVLAIKAPLTIASHRMESLTNSGDSGVQNKESTLKRLDYWEWWNLQHIECLARKQKLSVSDLVCPVS